MKENWNRQQKLWEKSPKNLPDTTSPPYHFLVFLLIAGINKGEISNVGGPVGFQTCHIRPFIAFPISLVSFTSQYPSLISVYLITSSQTRFTCLYFARTLSFRQCLCSRSSLAAHFSLLSKVASVIFNVNSNDTVYSVMQIPSRLVYVSEIRRDILQNGLS